jgi:hypothetical protein
MKGKRGKNEKSGQASLPGKPFESLLPEAQVNCRSLAGLLARFCAVRLPGFTQWQIAQHIHETYSSGDCSGIAPDSLFILGVVIGDWLTGD